MYQTVCHLQRRNEKDTSVCLDTGCSMSSTFDIADFETPPVEGRFGQLRTINDVIPIVGAGIIRWTVHDHVGNEAIIRVPGYYIPTSTQRLLSPQNYALFHGWDEPTVTGGLVQSVRTVSVWMVLGVRLPHGEY